MEETNAQVEEKQEEREMAQPYEKEGLFTRIGKKIDSGTSKVKQGISKHKGKIVAGLLVTGILGGMAYASKNDPDGNLLPFGPGSDDSDPGDGSSESED